jgi:hypothetical protein
MGLFRHVFCHLEVFVHRGFSSGTGSGIFLGEGIDVIKNRVDGHFQIDMYYQNYAFVS